MTRRKLAILVVLSAAGVAVGGTLAGQWAKPKTGGSVPAELRPIRVVLGERLAICHDVGEMPRNSRREVPFAVANRGHSAVTLGAFRASCDCFRVELDTTRIEAGTEARGRAVIDLAGEAQFVGGLMLDAEASAEEDGRTVFVLKLSVQVK